MRHMSVMSQYPTDESRERERARERESDSDSRVTSASASASEQIETRDRERHAHGERLISVHTTHYTVQLYTATPTAYTQHRVTGYIQL